jgi:short subunit dehydrogenase
VGDQLNRTKSRLVPVQLIPRFVLAAGGSALLAARPRQRPPLGAAVPAGGSLAGAYGGLPRRTWAAGTSGRDAYGAVMMRWSSAPRSCLCARKSSADGATPMSYDAGNPRRHAMTTTLDGRTALVTGAGRGIGRAIAIGLGRRGARVGLLARTQRDLDEVAAEIRDDGGTAIALAADIGHAGPTRADRRLAPQRLHRHAQLGRADHPADRRREPARPPHRTPIRANLGRT